MSQISPPTTRLRSTPTVTKKSTKELENAEGINTDMQTKEQAIIFLQGRDYLVPGKPANLQTLAHVLLQFGNASIKMPKVIMDGIRAVAFLMANTNTQQMANKVAEMVKIQIQEQMEAFNTNVETMRDAVEHVTNAARDITTKIDEIKDGLGESTDHVMEAMQELKNTTHKLIEKIAENKTAPHTTPAQPTNTAYTTYAVIAQ
jgi:hypothetical protein